MLFQEGGRHTSGADSSPHTEEQGLYTEPASTSIEAGEFDRVREGEATSTPIGEAAAGMAGSRSGRNIAILDHPLPMTCFLLTKNLLKNKKNKRFFFSLLSYAFGGHRVQFLPLFSAFALFTAVSCGVCGKSKVFSSSTL